DQTAYGAALQWSAIAGDHQLAIGATHDRSRSDFAQSAQAGVFDPTRAVIETDPQEQENALTGTMRSNSAFLADTWSLRPDLHVTLSGRYNITTVALTDAGPS